MMANQSVGLIEVRGLVTAVHVIDAMVKAAGVKHLSTRKDLGGGLVTVVVEGDVGSVRAALEAGRNSISGRAEVFCSEIIPRPHPGLNKYLK